MPYKSSSKVVDNRRTKAKPKSSKKPKKGRKGLMDERPALGGEKMPEKPEGYVYGSADLKHRPKSVRYKGSGANRKRWDFDNKRWVADPE